jgi:hypothetical protein
MNIVTHAEIIGLNGIKRTISLDVFDYGFSDKSGNTVINAMQIRSLEKTRRCYNI